MPSSVGEIPWDDLFDPGRTTIRAGAWDYLKENKDYPYYLIKDRLAGPDGHSLRSLARGQGKILEIQRPARRGVSKPVGHGDAAFACLHASRVRGGVERRGVHMGLPVPRVAVQADWRRALRTGGIAAQQGRGVIALLSSDHSPATSRHPGAITSLDAAEQRARRLQAVARRHSTRGYTRRQEA